MSTPKRVVEAEEFVLKGSDGKVLARIGEDEGGGVAFRLYDANGVNRYFIGLGPEGNPIIALSDEKESPRFVISHGEEGTGIQILDEDKKARARITLTKTGVSAITLNGLQSREGIMLWVDKESSKVSLHNAQGELKLGLVVDENGQPAIATEELGNILKAFSTE